MKSACSEEARLLRNSCVYGMAFMNEGEWLFLPFYLSITSLHHEIPQNLNDRSKYESVSKNLNLHNNLVRDSHHKHQFVLTYASIPANADIAILANL